MTRALPIDGRRAEAIFQELRAFTPHYVAELDLSNEQSAALALMKVFAHLAEAITSRIDRVPERNAIAFLDRLGIGLLRARPASATVQFKLTSTLTEPVTIPAGARISASGPDG